MMPKFDLPMERVAAAAQRSNRMTTWHEILADHYSTSDTVPLASVRFDDLMLKQGDDLIVLSVDTFEQFVTEVREVIAGAS